MAPQRDVVPAEKPAAVAGKPPPPIAVVGVHGISPIQQYAFQDQFATGLLAYLNARDDRNLGIEYVERRCGTDRRTKIVPHVPERRKRHDRRSMIPDRRTAPRPAKPPQPDRRRVRNRWIATPYWPRVSKRAEDPVLKPSALRLHLRAEDNYTQPATQVYDVYEGYWSPLSKGKSKLASLMLWLLRCTFLATSSTARLPATWESSRGISATCSSRLRSCSACSSEPPSWVRMRGRSS